MESGPGWCQGVRSDGDPAGPHFRTASPGSPLCPLGSAVAVQDDTAGLAWPGGARGPGSQPCPEGEQQACLERLEALCVWFLFCIGRLPAHAGPWCESSQRSGVTGLVGIERQQRGCGMHSRSKQGGVQQPPAVHGTVEGDTLPLHPAATREPVLAGLEETSSCPSLQQSPGQRQVLPCASCSSDPNSHIFGGSSPQLSVELWLRVAAVLGENWAEKQRLWRTL